MTNLLWQKLSDVKSAHLPKLMLLQRLGRQQYLNDLTIILPDFNVKVTAWLRNLLPDLCKYQGAPSSFALIWLNSSSSISEAIAFKSSIQSKLLTSTKTNVAISTRNCGAGVSSIEEIIAKLQIGYHPKTYCPIIPYRV